MEGHHQGVKEEVYRKEDQQLKYMDQQNSTVSKSINKLYPDHAAALNTANLVNGKFPRFRGIWKNQVDDVAKEEKKKKQKDNRN
eukprot:11706326-Ditylum_brightwellii.AAC.1